MARVCSICGKGTMSGNKVSHSHRKTRRTWGANIHKIAFTKDNGSVKREYVSQGVLRLKKDNNA